MTLSISYYDGVKYHSSEFINRDKDFFGNGVVKASHFPYTLPTPNNMTLSIGSGVAWVDGYRIQNDSNTVTLTVSQADATNPRIDIVQIGHDDINSQAVLTIKTGVAAASPVEPQADPNYLKLFAINVPANATAISSSNITDKRTLVPLNVSGTQINLAGAAGTGQTNNFTQTQQFSAPTSSIEAIQIILGLTNYISSPTSPIYLASGIAQGIGMDQYGNLLPINPAAIVAGNNWNVQGKNGTKDFLVYLDGTHKVATKNNVLDDGTGNSSIAGMQSMPNNPANTVQGTNTNLTMAANTDTLLPFLPGSPVTQPGESQWNNGQFTAPADGWYLVNTTVRCTLPLNTAADIKLFHYTTSGSGAWVGPMGRAYNANQSQTEDVVATGTHMVHLAAGEYIKLYINSSSASTTVNMSNCRATIVKVG